ncbi:hypothetical protein PHLCEN_2v8651 [Hermanssonia centrifuga]|uniref:F-box domain-containing protein n=1 Tax=Hermanssonia centrifuga TaxID=98765 RepID=A0A2R6NT39_9APHY|nr:hypothetical protein PHLCEN_2v8651 [Hermanssonia centrifuga]
MPLDIFFEVCTFHYLSSKDSLPIFYVNSKITSKLKPLDLIQLSRVSKQFRNIFMSKSSRYVWIEARKNVHGMPDPPDCLPEPKYASVVFERNCFVSAQSKAVQIQPKLVAAIALEKERKVWAERGVRIGLRRQEVRTLYQLYIEDIEDDEVLLPDSVEFTYLPEVTALVSRDDGLIEVTQERFMDVVAEAMTTFNISERAKLANMLREQAPRFTDYDSSDEDDGTISRTPMEIACDLEVLNRATSILKCYRCSLSSPTSYFPFTKITRHNLKFHPDSPYKAISREKAVTGTASAVLKVLGLPSSTRYSDISRKIVCLCGKPDFQQPAEFSELILHITRENSWYIQALRSP